MDEHIANAKLYEVVVEEAALSPIEIDHLRTCDECMEVVRIMVRNRVSALVSSAVPMPWLRCGGATASRLSSGTPGNSARIWYSCARSSQR